MQCSCFTRKGKPCPIGADRVYKGKPVCHVHDPNGLAAQNRRKSKPLSSTDRVRAMTLTQEIERELAEEESESLSSKASPSALEEAFRRIEDLEYEVDRLKAIVEPEPNREYSPDECPFAPQLLDANLRPCSP